MSLLILSSFLLCRLGFYPTREAVQKVLGFETATKQPSQLQHYTVTFVLFFVILFGGFTVRSLGKVYGLVGGVSATTLAFILPSIAYWVTSKKARSDNLAATTPATLTPPLEAPTYLIEPTLTQSSTLYHGISSSNNTYSGYYYYGSDATEDKRLLWDVASTSSSSHYHDEDASTVGGNDLSDDDDTDMENVKGQAGDYSMDNSIGKPNLFLDIMAVILFIWGFAVMIISVSSVLSSDWLATLPSNSCGVVKYR